MLVTILVMVDEEVEEIQGTVNEDYIKYSHEDMADYPQDVVKLYLTEGQVVHVLGIPEDFDGD